MSGILIQMRRNHCVYFRDMLTRYGNWEAAFQTYCSFAKQFQYPKLAKWKRINGWNSNFPGVLEWLRHLGYMVFHQISMISQTVPNQWKWNGDLSKLIGCTIDICYNDKHGDGEPAGWHYFHVKNKHQTSTPLDIVSLSLSVASKFECRLSDNNDNKRNNYKCVDFDVGDVCLMYGMTNEHYQRKFGSRVSTMSNFNIYNIYNIHPRIINYDLDYGIKSIESISTKG